MNSKYKEIEVRFLEIDEQALKRKLLNLGAEDKGEDKITGDIFYHKDKKFDNGHRRFTRIRKTKKEKIFTYKHQFKDAAEGTDEIEFVISDAEAMAKFLEVMGWQYSRRQQKKRHKFLYNSVFFDIDTWPNIPTYVELEGPSEKALREVAEKTGLDWSKVDMRPPWKIFDEEYGVKVHNLRYFTFDKIE